jgi:dihydroxyacetone kinase
VNLPRRQKQIYTLMMGRGDVPITDIYELLTDIDTALRNVKIQTQQRYLGPYITALNRNLEVHGLRCEPGALKNTYRIVAV